jgi:hypothetical protein
MYDFLKIRNNADEMNILRNELLKFGFNQDINEPTEEITYPITTKGRYKNFEFKITDYSIFSNGSIHKYWQNGTNWGDLDLMQVKQAIERYSEEFDVNPEKSRIHKLEFGVNINPPFAATLKNIRNTFISYKGTPFESLKSYSGQTIGVECNLSHYRLKIYSKTLQYKLKQNVLRFEIQVRKMQKLPFEQVFLSDLLTAPLINYCRSELIEVMESIIIYDNSLQGLSVKEKIFLKDIANPNYWANLNPSNRHKKKVKYDELVKSNSKSNLKNVLIRLVKEKSDVLTNYKECKQAMFLPLV